MTWAASIEQLWRSPNLPLWIVLVTAGILGVLVLVALLRERSFANTVLAVIAVAAIAANAIMTLRSDSGAASVERTPAGRDNTSSLPHPSLACLETAAGETVLAACEKVLFGSADSVAAAVSHTASQLNRLSAIGDVKTADKALTPEVVALRRAIERDRYGLVAYVLASRDGCQPTECAAFANLTDHTQITTNMEERLYEANVQRYAAGWGSGPSAASPSSGLTPGAGLPASVPSGKPTNADFPTSASIPPVSIMSTEPPPAPPKTAAAPVATAPAAAPAAPAAKATSAPPRNHAASSAPSQAQAAARSTSAPKNPPAPPKPQKPAAPVQLTPAPASAE